MLERRTNGNIESRNGDAATQISFNNEKIFD